MKRNVDVIVETGKDLYSCFMVGAEDLGFGIHGDGKTVKEAIKDFRDGYEEMKDVFAEEGRDCPELEFIFIFDIGAYFDYYPINVSALAKYSGLNASQLRQYVCGARTPSTKTIRKIKESLDKFISDIAAGHLIDKPVLQYI